MKEHKLYFISFAGWANKQSSKRSRNGKFIAYIF